MKKVFPKDTSAKDIISAMVKNDHQWYFINESLEERFAKELDGVQNQTVIKNCWNGWGLLIEAKVDGKRYTCSGNPEQVIFCEIA